MKVNTVITPLGSPEVESLVMKPLLGSFILRSHNFIIQLALLYLKKILLLLHSLSKYQVKLVMNHPEQCQDQLHSFLLMKVYLGTSCLLTCVTDEKVTTYSNFFNLFRLQLWFLIILKWYANLFSFETLSTNLSGIPIYIYIIMKSCMRVNKVQKLSFKGVELCSLDLG